MFATPDNPPFTSNECEMIKAMSELFEPLEAPVSSDGGVTNELSYARKTRVRYIGMTQDTLWLYKKIFRIVTNANSRIWEFDLTSTFLEPAQLLHYEAPSGHFDWHIDVGPLKASTRKLTIIIQLSDPDTYEGGDLLYWNGSEEVAAPKGEGKVSVFPSFMMHKVKPVTEGERWSLAAWAPGPWFR